MNLLTNTKTPKITGTYKVCPIPYKLDTYTGCTFGCKYCFAKDIIEGIRKLHNKSDTESSFNYLVGADVKAFKRWVESTMKRESNTADRIAFKERIPIKLGVVADPFPYIEKQTRITHDILKILNEIDYPVQISTKNPSILADYIDDFISGDIPNWAISVTLITIDESFKKYIEPYAPSIENRLSAIEKLVNKGLKVLVRIQPVIYPYIMGNMNKLITKIHDSGAYGIIMEGLKIKCKLDKTEQAIFQEIGDYLGYDIRQWYKDNGIKTGVDYEIKKEDKIKYINHIKELCSKYDIKVFIGDNNCRDHSCNGECCGTQFLRNHKTLRQSEKLMNCKPTGLRIKTDKTIGENILI
jgi:DNA repair photolyase